MAPGPRASLCQIDGVDLPWCEDLYDAGNYTLADLANGSDFQTSATSVSVAPGWGVTLYSRDNFTGANTTFINDMKDADGHYQGTLVLYDLDNFPVTTSVILFRLAGRQRPH
jgi:hypothetical protein